MWSPLMTLRPGTAPKRPAEPGEALSHMAAFLKAGLTPSSAWREVAAGSPETDIPVVVVRNMDAGFSLHDAIVQALHGQSVAWRMVGASWSIARDSGSPLASTLSLLAQSVRENEQMHRQIRATVAGPRATMRLVMLLPVMALAAGAVTGVNALGILFGTPLGLTALAVAGALMVGAWWWMRALQRGALPGEDLGALELDLFAIATSGGALPEAAASRVERAMIAWLIPPSSGTAVSDLTALSRRVGVPVSGLAKERAVMMRSLAAVEALEATNRLEVKVVVPLGLLVLPAFVLVGILPMGVAMWNQAQLA